jgi:glycosyltransferase involved in cell wall biosynthesis
MRTLIASHSHPQLSKGGAELAAHQLFQALGARESVESWFLGCVRDQMNQKLGATITQPFSDREYLYSAGTFDWFKFANGDPKFPREFRELLQKLQPDAVHFHHYLNFGVEAFLHVRETLPECRIVLTLHEYLAVCHHYGQMITKQNKTLCYESGPVRCGSCFKDIAPGTFFLRQLYIKRFFDLVDHFVAPSEFLAERYIAWGVPRERVVVLENVIAPPLHGAVAVSDWRRDSDVLRVGFFGQISSLKGINVIFEAAEILQERKIDRVLFDIYGDHTGQPLEFQTDFVVRLGKVGGNVRFQGPYDQQRVDRLMQSVDLVLVPSIWWENSPVVIQEAFRNRRPVLCSDIGGMAEKVRDGVDGLHFPVGNAMALASLLIRLADAPGRVVELQNSIRTPASVEEILDRYLDLYAERRPAAPAPKPATSEVLHHA